MNTPRALVVEDDKRLAALIGEIILHSLSHEFDHVTNQTDALARLNAVHYDYVLLDLHIPARPNRGGASHEFGVNLLRAIRERQSPTQLPVFIMTAYHSTCVDNTSELTRAGATEFISKPFPETGRTLAAVVRTVLDDHHTRQRTSVPLNVDLKPFNGGTMVFSPDRIELLGETIVQKRERANYWAVLHALKHRRDNGSFIAVDGAEMAKKFKGGKATQNTVSSCINDLRSRITKAMATRGLRCGKKDVILSGGPGYQLKEWIKAEERDGDMAGTCGDREMSDVPAPRPNVPATSANVPLNDRQHWVLEQLRAGVELQRQDVERQFRVGDKTAKRDLSDLVGRGLIAFERTPRPGHYRIVTKEGSGRPTHKILENRDLQRGLGERVHEPV